MPLAADLVRSTKKNMEHICMIVDLDLDCLNLYLLNRVDRKKILKRRKESISWPTFKSQKKVSKNDNKTRSTLYILEKKPCHLLIKKIHFGV